MNKEIFSAKRGAGYWLWKPWIILNTMLNIARPCDIICYCDAGTVWESSKYILTKLAAKIKYGVMTFMHNINGWNHEHQTTERWWSKRDAMILLGVDIDEMYDTVQRKATYSCYQVNPDSIHFVSEWLYFAMDKRIISDDKGALGMNDLDKFVDNRHDQTIMSLLSKKYGIPAFMDPSQLGTKDAQIYGAHVLNWELNRVGNRRFNILSHTRKKG